MVLPERLSARNVRRILDDPRLLVGHLRRRGSDLNRAINDRLRTRDGTFVMAEEWDTLVILDACRYDTFESTNTLSGRLSKRRSRGSTSIEFLERNFAGERHHDTVYVTANPYVARLPTETFHAVVPTYETAWDDEHETVLPDAMTDELVEAHETYPDKRIVGHYMQPHYPFIGERGRQIDHRGFHPKSDGQADLDAPNVWHQLQFGTTETAREEVVAAYRENLAIALESVRTLLGAVDGKVVLTADHGNLLGERLWPIPVRGFGHPHGSHAPGLLEVPWFEPPHSTRRETTAEAPDPESETDEPSVVSDRLRALGYRD